MKWLGRSLVPSMLALAGLVAFLPHTGPTIKVRLKDFKFLPSQLTVEPNTSVLIENDGTFTHTFTCPACHLSTGDIGPGASAVVKFRLAGSFEFLCIYHEAAGMSGRVFVGTGPAPAASGSAPTPSPTASS